MDGCAQHVVLLLLVIAGPTAAQSVSVSRRALLPRLIGSAASCVCCSSAHALATISPATDPAALPRDAGRDSRFAGSMANGMGSYEAAIAPTKKKLFGKVLANLPREDAVVVELGMGTFPNAPFYATVPGAPKAMDIVGVDPNIAMEDFAINAAAKAGLDRFGHTVRMVEGVGEALPFADGTADAVVCTLTLCSARSPAAVLAEVRRVLKPGGAFLFVEHVLSPTSESLAATQRALTPLQVASADNCHLDRQTLETIRSAGFTNVDAEEFELSGFWILSPTAAGIATR